MGSIQARYSLITLNSSQRRMARRLWSNYGNALEGSDDTTEVCLCESDIGRDNEHAVEAVESDAVVLAEVVFLGFAGLTRLGLLAVKVSPPSLEYLIWIYGLRPS